MEQQDKIDLLVASDRWVQIVVTTTDLQTLKKEHKAADLEVALRKATKDLEPELQLLSKRVQKLQDHIKAKNDDEKR